MIARQIDFDVVELHVTHNCNLACQGCNHYSNFSLKPWMISIEEFESWVQPWAKKINPSTFNILGGEPTIHPQLCELVERACYYFPNGRFDSLGGPSSVCINTNGFFLHKHPGLKDLMLKNNVKLFLSLHHKAPEYLDKLRDNLKMVRDWMAEGLNATIYDYSIHREWSMFYRQNGDDILPFADQAPRLSWEHCAAKRYTQLFEGKIWKCAPLAYLKLMNNLHESWNPYLKYQPLGPEATAKEITEFLAIEHEDVCSMCPANPKVIDIPIPLRINGKLK